MKSKLLKKNRGTKLRKNTDSQTLNIDLKNEEIDEIYLINERNFITQVVSQKDLQIAPNHHYMVINKGSHDVELNFSLNISSHPIIYDPYKFEKVKKEKIDPKSFQKKFNIPKGFADVLPKWYSIKFSYPEFNIIYLKPEMGISIQIHEQRTEFWEILEGKPIVLSGNKVNYYVRKGSEFKNKIGDFHTIINPNSEKDEYVTIKEKWSGNFDEEDIFRIFNPNHYH